MFAVKHELWVGHFQARLLSYINLFTCYHCIILCKGIWYHLYWLSWHIAITVVEVIYQ